MYNAETRPQTQYGDLGQLNSGCLLQALVETWKGVGVFTSDIKRFF